MTDFKTSENQERCTRAGSLCVAVICATLASCAASDTDLPADNTSDPEAEAGVSRDGGMECDVIAPMSCSESELTFADIEPLLQTYCVSCHYGEPGGPWPLLDYQDVADWYDIIRSSLLDCSMPPPDEGVMMPVEEREVILQWLRCGYPK